MAIGAGGVLRLSEADRSLAVAAQQGLSVTEPGDGSERSTFIRRMA